MSRVDTHAPGLDAASAPARTSANREELLRLRRSPRSFALTAITRLEALSAAAQRQLTAGADRCEPDMSLYKPGGGPPPCKAIPLDEVETKAQRVKLAKELATRKATIEANSEAFHALLSRMLPADVW